MAKNTIRSFIALDIPDDLKIKLDSYLKQLREISPKIKWAKSESIHLTIKFLGDITQSKKENLDKLLAKLSTSLQAFELSTGEFNAFPSKLKPRVIWLGLKANPQELLNILYHDVEEQLESIGFKPEKKKFSPHLTLGRIKFPVAMDDVWNLLELQPMPEFSFKVNELVLYQSVLKTTGAEYLVQGKYSLQTL